MCRDYCDNVATCRGRPGDKKPPALVATFQQPFPRTRASPIPESCSRCSTVCHIEARQFRQKFVRMLAVLSTSCGYPLMNFTILRFPKLSMSWNNDLANALKSGYSCGINEGHDLLKWRILHHWTQSCISTSAPEIIG